MERTIEVFADLYEAWAAAIKNRDAAWFEAIEDPRFLYVGPDGTVRAKQDHIAHVVAGLKGELATTVERLELIGDLAFVVGTHSVRADVEAMSDLAPAVRERMERGARVRFSSVWLGAADASWQLLRHHTTVLDAGSA